jgi:hypothetical protein
MAITLNPDQERVLLEAIRSGLAETHDDALNQALRSLEDRLPRPDNKTDPSVGAPLCQDQ